MATNHRLTLRRRLALVLLLAGCARSSSTPGGSFAGEATTSSFHAEPLATADAIVCAGSSDVDGDGALDVVLVTGDALEVLYRSGTGWKKAAFARPKAQASFDPDFSAVQDRFAGCAVADFDRDGTPDVLVATEATGFVAWNAGAREGFQFAALPDFPGSPEAMSMGAATVDADGDGDLDVFVARNAQGAITAAFAEGCHRGEAAEIHCGDSHSAFPGAPSFLLVNDGHRGFTIARARGVERDAQVNSTLATDFDGDGRLDLVNAGDAAPVQLLRGAGDGTFSDAAPGLGESVPWHLMGATSGDLDGDGRLDLAFAAIGRPHVLLARDGRLETARDSWGFAPVAMWPWGAEAGDLDDDGDLDLVFESELLLPEEWASLCADCAFATVPAAPEFLVYRQGSDHHFAPEHPADLPANERGGTTLALTDLDADGVLDAIVVRGASGGTGQQAFLLTGQLREAGRHGVEGCAAPGTLVRACVGEQCREQRVPSGGSFAAIPWPCTHFGIGTASGASVQFFVQGAWTAPEALAPGARAAFHLQ